MRRGGVNVLLTFDPSRRDKLTTRGCRLSFIGKYPAVICPDLDHKNGVKTREQLDLVRRHGCNEIQGYFFSRPLPAGVFEQFARGRPAH